MALKVGIGLVKISGQNVCIEWNVKHAEVALSHP